MSFLVPPNMRIPKGSIGMLLEFTLYDGDVVLNISAATAMDFYAKDGENTQVVDAEPLDFVNDGSDGKLKMLAPAELVADAQDLWCDIEVTEPTGVYRTEVFRVEITETAKVV